MSLRESVSPPAYQVHSERNAMAPMRDGVRLAADVHRPARNGQPLEEPLPVLLHRRPCQDLKAGIDYLHDAGYPYVALLGHSMGAVRVAYYAATQSDPRVNAVVPISPVRLSYSYYLNSKDAQEFLGIIRQAQELESAGRGRELLDVKFPIPQLFCASSYLDKHGPAERYNLVNLAPWCSRGNFADPATKEMAEDLRKLGYACLTLNTMAHDTVD